MARHRESPLETALRKGSPAVNLIHLERIMFIAKIGNITEAAKQLYISQSALSQMVNTVEEELGTPIFDRRVKPLRLTKAGERYIAMARYITNAHNAMLNEIYNIKSGTSGVITCGISARRSREMLPYILRATSKAYPLMSVRLFTGEVSEFEALLLRGELDLAFGSLPPNDPNIGSFTLNDERYMLVAPSESPFAKRMDAYRVSINDPAVPIPLYEARDERFVVTPPGAESRNALNSMFEEAHIRPLIAIEVSNTDIAMGYSKTGLGVSVIPHGFPNNKPFEYRTDSITMFNISSKYAMRNLYLNYDKSIAVSPPHRYLINLILKEFGSKNAKLLPEL